MEARATASGSSGLPEMLRSGANRAKAMPSPKAIHTRRSILIHLPQDVNHREPTERLSKPRSAVASRLNGSLFSRDAKRGAQSSRELYARAGLEGRVRW